MTKMTQKNYEAIKIYRQKEQIFELKGLVQRLRNNVEDLTLQKDLLIVENNKLRGLLKECRRAFETYAKEDETCGLEEENKYAKHLLPRINAAIGDNEIQANSVADIKI